MTSEIKFTYQTPPPERRGGAARKYEPLLNEIKNNKKHHDKWILLVEFDSTTGARDAKHRLITGQSATPEGNWEFRAAKTEDGSNLFAILKGEQ
jgi:hypothetical protein